MALSRCLKQHAGPKGRTTTYIGFVRPVGYPDTALVCGHCDRPGVIWVNREEAEAYGHGQRVFQGPNKFTQMRAGEKGFEPWD